MPRRTFECGSAPQLQSALNDVAHAAFDKAGRQQRETVAVSSRKRMRFGWLARTAFLFLGSWLLALGVDSRYSVPGLVDIRLIFAYLGIRQLAAIVHPEKNQFRNCFPTHFPDIHNRHARTIAFALDENSPAQTANNLIGHH